MDCQEWLSHGLLRWSGCPMDCSAGVGVPWIAPWIAFVDDLQDGDERREILEAAMRLPATWQSHRGSEVQGRRRSDQRKQQRGRMTCLPYTRFDHISAEGRGSAVKRFAKQHLSSIGITPVRVVFGQFVATRCRRPFGVFAVRKERKIAAPRGRRPCAAASVGSWSCAGCRNGRRPGRRRSGRRTANASSRRRTDSRRAPARPH